jgi:hypothetical protein
MTVLGSSTPWTLRQLLGTVGVNVAGLIVIGAAWYGVGGASTLTAQIPWVNLAVLGLVLAFSADGALLLGARRAVGRSRLQLVPGVAVVTQSTSPAPVWVWVPGTRRAHRPGCPLVAGKAACGVDAVRIRAERLIRCEACEP